MTREEALQNLNLPSDADREAIEKAYHRLVRRYPPEFHPEKFRLIDESYRQLASLPAMIETLLAPAVEQATWDPSLLTFTPSLPESHLDRAIQEVRAIAMAQILWKPPAAAGARDKRHR